MLRSRPGATTSRVTVSKSQVPVDADGYMPRIMPTPDADKVLVYTMPRHPGRLNLYAVNPRSTVAHLLLKESVKKYVEEEAVASIKIGNDYILVPSDRDGYMHLYVYNHNGQLLRKIAPGNYDITAVYGMDEATGDIYYRCCPQPA